METSLASRVTGGLFALTGVLGIIILATDQILRESLGGQHWDGLLVFVVIDFAVAAYVAVKPSRTSLMFGAAWGILRIIIQVADIATAPMSQMSYGDFANYLFNPALVTSPNPPGVPAAFIDLIIILEVVIVGIVLSGRHVTPQSA